MGSPITGMLLGQAAPSGIADSSLSNLSPEAQALIKQLAQQGQLAEKIEPMPSEPVAQPMQTIPPQQGGIWEMLKGAFSRMLPSTASMAPKVQPTPQALTPEMLAERNRILAGGQ